jgi:hypothetical protein
MENYNLYLKPNAEISLTMDASNPIETTISQEEAAMKIFSTIHQKRRAFY